MVPLYGTVCLVSALSYIAHAWGSRWGQKCCCLAGKAHVCVDVSVLIDRGIVLLDICYDDLLAVERTTV